MLGNHVGDVNLAVGGLEGLLNKKLFVNENRITATGEVIIKIVNSEAQAREIQIEVHGMNKPPLSGREIVLTGQDLNAGNAFDKPLNVAPVEKKLEKPGDSFTYLVKPHSFTVLRLINP